MLKFLMKSRFYWCATPFSLLALLFFSPFVVSAPLEVTETLSSQAFVGEPVLEDVWISVKQPLALRLTPPSSPRWVTIQGAKETTQDETGVLLHQQYRLYPKETGTLDIPPFVVEGVPQNERLVHKVFRAETSPKHLEVAPISASLPRLGAYEIQGSRRLLAAKDGVITEEISLLMDGSLPELIPERVFRLEGLEDGVHTYFNAPKITMEQGKTHYRQVVVYTLSNASKKTKKTKWRLPRILVPYRVFGENRANELHITDTEVFLGIPKSKPWKAVAQIPSKKAPSHASFSSFWKILLPLTLLMFVMLVTLLFAYKFFHATGQKKITLRRLFSHDSLWKSLKTALENEDFAFFDRELSRFIGKDASAVKTLWRFANDYPKERKHFAHAAEALSHLRYQSPLTPLRHRRSLAFLESFLAYESKHHHKRYRRDLFRRLSPLTFFNVRYSLLEKRLQPLYPPFRQRKSTWTR